MTLTQEEYIRINKYLRDEIVKCIHTEFTHISEAGAIRLAERIILLIRVGKR